MANGDRDHLAQDERPIIVRTERGLVFADRPRVTLYDLMDYLRAGYPPHLIADRFRLSERQVRGAIEYIAAHDEEVEREYREVLAVAEDQRRSWEERNHERLAQIAAAPPPPEQRELRARIAALKARLAHEVRDDSREVTEGERTAAQ